MFAQQTTLWIDIGEWTTASWSAVLIIGLALTISSFYLGWYVAHHKKIPKLRLESQALELDLTRIEARTDPLSGIWNRKAVDERLDVMVTRFQGEAASFGLMVVDVDHFKHVNDTFGHPVGDQVLIRIAAALKYCVRPEDFVGRLGGDEFVILFDGLTAANAQAVATRVQGSIEKHDFSVEDNHNNPEFSQPRPQSTVVTLSMGLAIVGINDDAASLYERADRALYKSKELGRNRLYTLLEEQPVARIS